MNLIPTTHRVVPLRHYIYTLAKMPKNKTDKYGKKYDKLYLDRIRKYSKKMKMIVDDKGNFFNHNYDESINLINKAPKKRLGALANQTKELQKRGRLRKPNKIAKKRALSPPFRREFPGKYTPREYFPALRAGIARQKSFVQA